MKILSFQAQIIICDGVTDMIKERISHYVPYFLNLLRNPAIHLRLSMQEISKTEIKLN